MTPALGVAGFGDGATHRAGAIEYRMSRAARLAMTLATVAAVLVVTATAVMSAGPTGTTSVTVVAGDTLWSIAQRSVPDDDVRSVIDEISALNGLTGADIVAGQVLVVPLG